MKKFLLKMFTALFTFFIVCIYCNNKVASAKEDQNCIFNFDIDGYYKPSDKKSHDFIIENGNGESCYINGFSFKQTLINDIKTGKSYSLAEADKKGIIDAYNIVLSLADDKYGSKVLYDGKLKNLCDNDIEFKDIIYMDIGQKIKFNFAIYMDSDAGNEYKNKHYQVLMFSNCHKVVCDKVSGQITYNKKSDDYSDSDNGYMYRDENGNLVLDGYYDSEQKWHSGVFYDKDGVKHNQNFFYEGINRVNKFFKTGQGMVAVIGYEIMFIVCLFFIVYRIRQKQKAS